MTRIGLTLSLLCGAALALRFTALVKGDETPPIEPPKFEAIAEYAPADRAAAERIGRLFKDAGIRLMVTQSASATVNVDATRIPEAKALLRKIAAEGHPSVKTFTIKGGRAVLDER
jgi:hypothetical protein